MALARPGRGRPPHPAHATLPVFPLSAADMRRLVERYAPDDGDGEDTPAEAFQPASVADDPEEIIRWIESYYTVVSDAGLGLIPFKLYEFQKDVIRQLEGHREVIILKARQLGMTELMAAWILFKLCHHARWTAVILSKGENEAKEFLAKMRIGYDGLPDDARIPLKNPLITSVLLLANGSRAIPKATTGGSGRSYAAQILVLDEWAWMEGQEKVYGGAAPIARSAGNKIVGFSSANGDGNFFAQTWHDAREKQEMGAFDDPATADTSGMYPLFLPWSIRPGRDEAWYRQATANMPDWLRAQEFPTTEEEAFVLSGRPRFDVEALRAIRQTCRQPIHTDLEPKLGGLYVWEAPNPNGRYVIGADVAEGLEKGDYSVAVVLDYYSGVEVAALRGHWEPTTFARKLHHLGYMYGTHIASPLVPGGVSVVPAFLGVERNASGGTVLAMLTTTHQYPNLYYHQEYDATVEGKRPGWATTPRSKPIMIDALAAAIMERRPYRWVQFVEEALRYVRLENGETEASGSSHDDVVMAAAVAEMCRRFLPATQQVVSVAEELGLPQMQQDMAMQAHLHNPYAPPPLDPFAGAESFGVIDDRY